MYLGFVGGGSPWDHRVSAVAPLVQNLVEIAVADADLGDLDGDIFRAGSAAGEFERLQESLRIVCADADRRGPCE